MAWPFDDKPINPLVGTRVGNAMANPPETEMRNASALDQAFMGFNALGAHFGYPDIAQRTADTLHLLSLPSLLSLMGPGAAALKASDAAAPVMARVFRGSPIGETWTGEGGATSLGTRNPTYWASDNPEVANWYAGERGLDRMSCQPTSVSKIRSSWMPKARIGREFLLAAGRRRRIPSRISHANSVTTASSSGTFVIPSTGGPLGTTYAALRPGTVTSPLTGAPIYSLLAALAGQQLRGSEPPDSQR